MTAIKRAKNSLEIEKLEYVGIINRLEDTLFEGSISFRVASVFSK